jgi:uncharacterized protein YfaQ (DUF2300 family)
MGLKELIVIELNKQGVGTLGPEKLDKFASGLASAIDIYLKTWLAAEAPKITDTAGTPPSPAHVYTPA